jgi:hypothetical protein
MYFLLSYLYPCNFFSCLISLAKILHTIWNKSGESGHSCHIPDFRGNALRFSPLSMMLTMGFCYITFVMLRNDSYYLVFSGFYHENILSQRS